jgi:hypothetical protein
MNFLNPEGHQNRITGSKVTAILVKGQILPTGGGASGRVCACSLRSRLVLGWTRRYKSTLNTSSKKRKDNL